MQQPTKKIYYQSKNKFFIIKSKYPSTLNIRSQKTKFRFVQAFNKIYFYHQLFIPYNNSMQSINQKCKGGNNATHVCRCEDFDLNAVICDKNDCQCIKLHKNCHVFHFALDIYVGQLLKIDRKKRESICNVVVKWFDQTIDLLEHQRDKIQKQMLMDGSLMTLNQKSVYNQLRQTTNSCRLTSTNAAKAAKQIRSDDYIQLQQIFNRSQKQMARCMKQFSLIVDKVKIIIQSLKSSINLEYKFTPDMCSKLITIKEKTRSRVIKISNKSQRPANGYSQFALISPSLEDCRDTLQKFQFKILNLPSKQYAFIGMCHKQTAILNTFQHIKGDQAFYIVRSSDGCLINGSFPEQSKKESSFKFGTNDVIQIQWNPQNQTVKFTNVFKKLTQSLKFKLVENNELCLCVSMFLPSTKIEFLGRVN